jgi:hypothetical protein
VAAGGAPVTLSFTLTANNGTRSTTSTAVTVTVNAPSIALGATTAIAGQIVTATIANGPGNLRDWVGLFATGAPSANSLQWQYLDGTHTAPVPSLSGGTLSFTMPVTAGTYELRFFLNNTLNVLVISGPISVTTF